MSYNILSGSVNFADSQGSGQQGTIEDLVDTHTVQNIQGQKSFTGVLTASNFAAADNIFHYGDTDTKMVFSTDTIGLQAGGATMLQLYGSLSPKVLALQGTACDIKINTSGLNTYISGANGRIGIGMLGNYTHALEVAGDISASVNVSASQFWGEATGITNVSSSAITGIVHPQNIYYGSSLTASSSTGSLGVKLTASSGLELTGYGIRWNPNTLAAVGSVAGSDNIGIYDAVAGLPKKITVSTLTTTVLGDAAVTSYNGTNTNRVLTSGGEDTIDVEANLTFDGSTLAVTGAISGSTTLHVASHISGSGDLSLRWGLAQVANLYATADITGSSMLLAGDIVHDGDTNTSIGFGGNDFIRFTAGGSQMLGLYGNLAVKKVQVDASDFKVNTSGLDFFITSSTGRVGIGVSDPDHALEILSGSASQLKLSYDAANSVTFGASSGGNLAITPSGGDISLAGNVSIDGNTTLGNASGDSVTINALAVSLPNGLNFDSNTLFISASNNRVGIGTISPAHTLSVVGNVSASAELIINTVSASAQIHAPNIASGSIAGNGSYLGLSTTGHIVLTSSAGGSGGAVSAVANGADNRVATFSSADALNGEANLTFDGTDLGVSAKIFHVGDTDTFVNFTDDDINIQVGGVNMIDITEDTQNEITFNEGGVDVDFRVESVNDTHLLFVDASNDAVSIGVSTDAPAAVLEVAGDAAQGKPTLTVIHAENTNNAVNITADSITTAKALRISADALTTGNALYVDDDSSNTGTRNTAMVIQNNAAAIAATALTVQSDGGVTGVNLDKNYSDLTEASIVGLNIDFDKTGASTSDNNMYGIQLDMDNTTATNGNNYMYGLHVTPTLTHAADAGGSFVYGAHISA